MGGKPAVAYFRLPRREDWLLRPWSRLGVLLALISPLHDSDHAAPLLWIWREATGDPGSRQYALTTALFAVVALVIAITHVYETVFLLRDWESDRVRSARMEQARLETELESLGREVDPHFPLQQPQRARAPRRSAERGGALVHADAERDVPYVLECRGRTLVPLCRRARGARTAPGPWPSPLCRRRGVQVEVRPADAHQLLLRRFRSPSSFRTR